MTEKKKIEAHTPIIRRGVSGLMSIWIVPLIAVLIAGWLVIKTVNEKGTEISVLLQSAKGLETGKTSLKYKDVIIGIVERIEIPDDDQGVSVVVSVNQNAEKYLTETATFWVVAPAIGLEGVSGLDTLLSGAYLEIDPGAGGERERDFIGLERAPVITSTTAGRQYLLQSSRVGNVSRGTPVIYKGIRVGKILGRKLSEDRSQVELIAFVESPYDELVQEGTKFWDAGGINVTVSTDGIEVGAASLQALLSGSIEFKTPPGLKATWVAEEGYEFVLYGNRKSMEDAKFTEKFTYILYFDGSVSGLEVGASVEFKGMKIGSVKEINLVVDRKTANYFLPVIIEIEPQRVKSVESKDQILSLVEEEKNRVEVFESLIDRGLKGRLKSSNFLTGNLIVDLDLLPDKPPRYFAYDDQYPEIPTLPTELEEITTSLTRLVEKIERLPIDGISNSLLGAASGLERIVNSGKLEETIGEYKNLATSVRKAVDEVDRDMLPNINAAVVDMRRALQRVDTTLISATDLFTSASSLVADGSPVKYDLTVMMRELAAASRAVRNLAEYLERNPSSLLSGKK
ncbi:MAG: MlaD family protein [Sneathiella sp.]